MSSPRANSFSLVAIEIKGLYVVIKMPWIANIIPEIIESYAKIECVI